MKLVVATAAKVARAPELMPTVSWRFSSFRLHANATYSNISSVGIAISQRLATTSSSQIIFLSNSWLQYNLASQNLPPGEYKLQVYASTWYGALIESNVTFAVLNADAPVVYPIRIPEIVYRNQISQFSAQVVFSSCAEGSAPIYLWRVRNSERQLLFTQSAKSLTVAQGKLQLTGNKTHFVEFTVNGMFMVSSVFELAELPLVARVAGGGTVMIANSGGSISAD